MRARLGLSCSDCATLIHFEVNKEPDYIARIVGTRKDPAEAIEFETEGKVKAHIHQLPLEKIGDVFVDLKAGKVDGRIAIKF